MEVSAEFTYFFPGTVNDNDESGLALPINGTVVVAGTVSWIDTTGL